MGIKTVIVLSILAMAFGVFLLFVWIDQRRQQKRLRAIARYNRERQQQSRLDAKGPKIIDLGNKRVIIDPLVDGFDEVETDIEENEHFLDEEFETQQPVIMSKAAVTPRLTPRPTTFTAQRINPYAKVTQGHESHRPKSYSSQPQDQCCPHNHEEEDFLNDDEEELSEVRPASPQFQDFAAESESSRHNITQPSSIKITPFSSAPTLTASTASNIPESSAHTSTGQSSHVAQSTPSKPQSTQTVPDYLTFSLMAEKGKPFGGYDLLQSILGTGLRHGERQIFHRYDAQKPTKILFSMASIAKPGTFSVDSMGSFSTPGLIFIFEIERTPDLLNSFELLLETARQLSEDLDGNLLDDRREPLTTERIQALRQQLREITPVADYADED